MAKKPMTKAQIVSYFAKKFDLSRETASGIIGEVGALAVSETKKQGLLPFAGSTNWSWLRGKPVWAVILPLEKQSRFPPRL